MQKISVAAKVQGVVPPAGITPQASYQTWKILHSLAVIGGVKVAHVIAIDNIDSAFLAGLHQQMFMGRVQWLIGQKERASRTQVFIHRVQGSLVKRSEVISGGENAGRGENELDDAVALIQTSRIRVENAISGCGVSIEAGGGRGSSRTLPHDALRGIRRGYPRGDLLQS